MLYDPSKEVGTKQHIVRWVVTDNAGWDGMGFDLPLVGFSEQDLARLTGSNPGLTDPDEVPEPLLVPIAQRGEVWRLGRHRLVCGDATNAGDVGRALAGVEAPTIAFRCWSPKSCWRSQMNL